MSAAGSTQNPAQTGGRTANQSGAPIVDATAAGKPDGRATELTPGQTDSQTAKQPAAPTTEQTVGTPHPLSDQDAPQSGQGTILVEAQPASQPANLPEFGWSGYFSGLAVLFLMLAALWFALRFLKNRGGLRMFGVGSGVQVETRVSLGPKKNLLVVRAHGKRLLLGVTDHHISQLAELPLEEDDGEALEQSGSSGALAAWKAALLSKAGTGRAVKSATDSSGVNASGKAQTQAFSSGKANERVCGETNGQMNKPANGDKAAAQQKNMQTGASGQASFSESLNEVFETVGKDEHD